MASLIKLKPELLSPSEYKRILAKFKTDKKSVTPEELAAYRADHLMRYSRYNCPHHGYKIAGSLCKLNAYCPECNKFWALSRNMDNWRYVWFYLYGPIEGRGK